MANDLDTIEALLAAATPRPWQLWHDHPAHRCSIGSDYGHICSMAILRTDEGNLANRALITTVVNDLPGLIEEIKRLRAGHWKIIDHHKAMVETDHNSLEEGAWREASKVSEYALGLRTVPYDPS